HVTRDSVKRWQSAVQRATVLSTCVTRVGNGSESTVLSAISIAGMIAMTQSLAVEWGGRGIRVNAIAPGVFPTESAAARLDPTGAGKLGDDVPMHCTAEVSELANLAVYLMARGSAYVHHATNGIDGGLYRATGGIYG